MTAMRIGQTAAVALLMLLTANAGAADINLLTNGDFETGSLTGWTWTPTQYSDPAMSPAVVTFETQAGASSKCFRVNPGTDDTHYGIGREEGGTLSQSVFLEGGRTYDVSVGAAAIRDLGGGDNADGGLIRLYIGGDLRWSWDVARITAGETLRSSYTSFYVPSSTGVYDFEMTFTRTYMNSPAVMYHYVDDLRIPEPASLSLLAVSGVAFLKRRRRP